MAAAAEAGAKEGDFPNGDGGGGSGAPRRIAAKYYPLPPLVGGGAATGQQPMGLFLGISIEFLEFWIEVWIDPYFRSHENQSGFFNPPPFP